MLAACELIFEGHVIGFSTERIPSGLRTWVEFEVLEVVKGPPVGPTLSLAFLGGTLDGWVDRVAGLRLPERGERGIYFVESLQRFQVNPLFGWDQGRLRIEVAEDGLERVVSASGQPVVGLHPEVATLKRRVLGTGSGPAAGIEVNGHVPLESALSKVRFKAELIRALAEQSASEAK